jgi:hypothetical protein
VHYAKNALPLDMNQMLLSDLVIFSNPIRTLKRVSAGSSYKCIGVSCELLFNFIEVTSALLHFDTLRTFVPYFLCEGILLSMLFRQHITKHEIMLFNLVAN